ncbi:dihydrofolate reductase family protein [Paenibacillus sp. Soil724D2]|uniref:dihydrofolate reductase family protein n=1 Tax=Paenibacillus sp. (strain Soil724D2) TaxID=1736392 RepID=UPI0007152E32|nr:dihydrofolate reductase family protein [Paenibacillus sp. Soil724D2]KRE43158.1 hypothetical protein ASG85_33265 [Paenibacillus sp. Soil724D2]
MLNGNLAEEVRKLKEDQGSDITIFGSGTIVQQLANEGLIDEYLLVVTPVIVGAGKSLFEDVKEFKLELLEKEISGQESFCFTIKLIKMNPNKLKQHKIPLVATNIAAFIYFL